MVISTLSAMLSLCKQSSDQVDYDQLIVSQRWVNEKGPNGTVRVLKDCFNPEQREMLGQHREHFKEWLAHKVILDALGSHAIASVMLIKLVLPGIDSFTFLPRMPTYQLRQIPISRVNRVEQIADSLLHRLVALNLSPLGASSIEGVNVAAIWIRTSGEQRLSIIRSSIKYLELLYALRCALTHDLNPTNHSTFLLTGEEFNIAKEVVKL